MNILKRLINRFRKPNFALMDQALGHIRNNPHTWDQSIFDVGSHACFAGHAARIVTGKKYNCGGDVPEIAITALRINTTQANRLFNAYNTMDDLAAIIAEMKAKYGVRS